MAILTNEVTIALSRSAILADFFVYEILADDLRGEHFKNTILAVYRDIQPLSLIKPKGGNILILCKEKLPERQNHDDFRVKPLQDLSKISTLSDRTLARLLIHALTQLKYGCSSQGLGLYYLHDSKTYDDKKGTKLTYYYTFKLDIAPLTHDHTKSVVTIYGQSLTPRAYHANKDGTYPAKIAKSPSVSIDPFSSQINKTKKPPTKTPKSAKDKFATTEDYVERSIRNDRMTSEMLSLDVKNPDNFFLSKTGVLATFNQQVTEYLGKYLQLAWQSMPAEPHKFFGKTLIDTQYDKLAEILQDYTFYLVLKEPFTPLFTEQIIQHLEQKWGISLQVADECQPFSQTNKAINLLVHHDKAYYEERNLPDPYQQNLAENQTLLKQSLTLETLISDKNKLNLPAIDNAMTEIFVKIEVMLGKLLLIKPEQSWRCITARYKKSLNSEEKKDEFDSYNILDYCHVTNTLSYQPIDEFDDLAMEIDITLVNLTQTPAYRMQKHDHLLIQTSANDPITYLIQESNYRPLPEFIALHDQMTAIRNAHTQGFKREWARQYLAKIEHDNIQLDSDTAQKFIQKLQTLANSRDEIIKRDDFFKVQINYQGLGKAFIDWVYQTHGSLWNTSLRGKDTGYIEALKGFYYEPTQQYYFAGLGNGVASEVSNFSVMRKILTNQPNIKHLALLNLMDETFYIRHKQSTVLPFLFKHVREFSALNPVT